MATALYDKGRNAFLTGDIDWVNDDIRVIIIDTDEYEPNLNQDTVLSDIPAAARVAALPLTNRTAVDGVADADDVVFPSLMGPSIEAVVIYQNTGDESTSRLIAFIDNAQGFPFEPDGRDMIIRWSDGPNKIFKL